MGLHSGQGQGHSLWKTIVYNVFRFLGALILDLHVGVGLVELTWDITTQVSNLTIVGFSSLHDSVMHNVVSLYKLTLTSHAMFLLVHNTTMQNTTISFICLCMPSFPWSHGRQSGVGIFDITWTRQKLAMGVFF